MYCVLRVCNIRLDMEELKLVQGVGGLGRQSHQDTVQLVVKRYNQHSSESLQAVHIQLSDPCHINENASIYFKSSMGQCNVIIKIYNLPNLSACFHKHKR